jgi:excisionase family DNA binding protein
MTEKLPEKTYSVKEVAAYLGVTPGWVRHLISKGRLGSIKPGMNRNCRRVITQSDLDAYANIRR